MLQIDYVPAADVRPHPDNARVGDVEAIAQSIQVNGVYRPVIVQKSTGYILAGNHTYRALTKTDAEALIPVVFIDCDDEKARRIMLADNRTADLGGYDDAALAKLLSELEDLTGTGYDKDFLDQLLATSKSTQVLADPDQAPAPPLIPITRPGQIWILGRHRLICADSTSEDTYQQLLGDEQADCLWTDPPYGVSYQGKTKEALTIQNDGAGAAREVVEAFLQATKPHLRPGAPFYICHADTQRRYLDQYTAAAGFEYRQTLIWCKNTFTLGRSDYQLQHEPILYGFVEGAKGRKGRGGQHWHGPNNASTIFHIDKPNSSRLHPTMKPVDLIRPMLTNSTGPGGLILDAFGGSGSTLIAAQLEGRRAALVELDPHYADVIAARFEQVTGIIPIDAATGMERSVLKEVLENGDQEDPNEQD